MNGSLNFLNLILLKLYSELLYFSRNDFVFSSSGPRAEPKYIGNFKKKKFDCKIRESCVEKISKFLSSENVLAIIALFLENG